MAATQLPTAHRPADVLVVEDDRRVSQFLKRCLTLHGYEVSGVVASAADAIAHLEAHRPSIVIMDIQIEGPVDGVDLARLIRDRWDLPIVYVSGQGDDETVRRAVNTGPFGFVRKPFDDVQLRAALEVALHNAEAARARAAELERSKRERGELAASTASIQGRLRRIAEVVGVRPPAEAGQASRLPATLEPLVAELSPRERQVLRLLLTGHRVASVARTLSVSPYTVRNHLRALFRKLRVHSQEQLVEIFRGVPSAALAPERGRRADPAKS